MKKKTIIVAAVIIVLLLISLMLTIFTECQKERNEGGAIPEEQKLANTNEEIENIRLQIVPLIASAKWGEAYSILEDHFTTHKYEDNVGLELYDYYADLGTLCRMSEVDPQLYSEVFNSFKSPEPFIAAMVYYPASAKLGSFLSYDSLVPTTSINDLEIHQRKDGSDDLVSDMKLNFEDFKSGEVYEIMLENKLYDVALMERQDGTYGVWSVKCTQGDSYFMNVKEWEDIFNSI